MCILCVCVCACVCVWSIAWQPKFPRLIIYVGTSGLGEYKVARVGRPATDYKIEHHFPTV